MTKTFFNYVIPSMLAFALSGIYAIVDGFFVGNSVGDQGLATINLVYPLVALIQLRVPVLAWLARFILRLPRVESGLTSVIGISGLRAGCWSWSVYF